MRNAMGGGRAGWSRRSDLVIMIRIACNAMKRECPKFAGKTLPQLEALWREIRQAGIDLGVLKPNC